MDIEALGSHYLQESRYASSLADPRRQNEAETKGDFAALLNRAREETADKAPQDEVSGHSTKKPVIDKTDKLYEQCEALETFLVKTLITGMRNTIQKSEFLSGGFAGKMYEDMLYDEYAKDFTKNANFGLAELAYLELTGQRGSQIRG